MTYRAAVVGAAGFAGIELCRLILGHPEFELVCATSDALLGQRLASVYPALEGVCDLCFESASAVEDAQCDVAFLAVPHTAAFGAAPGLVARGVSVVDLSADFRFDNVDVYNQWYGVNHTATDLLAKRAFGLPELFGEGLAEAAARRSAGEAVVVGCAGCYPTATSLAAAPAVRAGLLRDDAPVVVDAISGVTGAGKKATQRTHFCFANENLEAYGVGKHRHTPEIEQILGLPNRVVFTPHLAPVNRGILSTVNLPLAKVSGAYPTLEEIHAMYTQFYANSAFVEVLPLGTLPRSASVAGTNRAQIGLGLDTRVGMLVALGAIDNLCKGAAGQAVQCANIVFGLDEACGLKHIATAV